jgi:cytochrome P450
MTQPKRPDPLATSSRERGDSTDDRIDRVLTGFINQLFSQRRRTAMRGPRGGAMISDPATVDAILRAPEQFPKIFDLVEAAGRNRFSTNGKEWELRRELTQLYYTRAGAAANRTKIAEVYARRLSTCATTKPAEIHRALLAASTEIFHEAFGCSIAVEPMLGFFDRARSMLKRLQYFSLIPPTGAERSALKQDAQALSQFYWAEIERSDGLKALMESFTRQAEGPIADFKPADELMMNFFAAIESGSGTLSTAIDRLGVYPAAQDKLYSEVIAGGACPGLECFINEVMRCYPPIPVLIRLVAADAQIEQLRLKAGSVIAISIVGVHRHPAHWKDADVFDCARTEFTENRYDRRAFIPFASGIRSCGGARLARLELTEGLKAFIRRFIVARGGDAISFDYAIAMRPKTSDSLTISRRPT